MGGPDVTRRGPAGTRGVTGFQTTSCGFATRTQWRPGHPIDAFTDLGWAHFYSGSQAPPGNEKKKLSVKLVGAGPRAGLFFQSGPAGTPGPTCYLRSRLNKKAQELSLPV